MNKAAKLVPIYNIETKVMHALGFDILNLQGAKGKTYDSSELHRHTFFELFFFTDGKGDHEIDFMHYPVTKGSIHFVSPGQIHQLSLKQTQGYVFCFTEDFIPLQSYEHFTEKFPFYDGSNAPVIHLNKVFALEISKLVTVIVNEFRLSNSNTDVLQSYMNILLLKIKASCCNPYEKEIKAAPVKNAKVLLFKKLINTNYLSHKSVSNYASQLSVSPNHLNALCKIHEGKTAIQLLHERLLLEAKRLLYATDLNIKEISFQLMFEDVGYFNRFFKKQTDLTPVQYRMHSNKNR